MTLPCATLGDATSCGDTIGEGSGDVFINNKPAATLGSMTTGHTLPGHGFYPPVPILTGSGSVFVNNKPIARLSDAVLEHCDPPHPSPDCHASVIAAGSGDVFAG